MKPLTIALVAGAAFLSFRLGRRFFQSPTESLREDKPAPTLPQSSAMTENRPRTNTAINLPTVIAGIAPPWKWKLEDVANIFVANGAGENKT